MSNKCQLVSFEQKKNRTDHQKWLSHAVSLVAGVGLEPHDLRVMSAHLLKKSVIMRFCEVL